jgi:hypothetical protein
MKYSYKMSLNKKNIEKFEGTKIVMKSCRSTKDRQYIFQRKTDKKTNNDLQHTT